MPETTNIGDVVRRETTERGAEVLGVPEEKPPRLVHPSDAEPRMAWSDGIGRIVSGDGSYIELNPEGENRYHPANR